MAFIINTAKTVRNNWKKTIFFGSIIAYGVDYGRDKYLINNLMREYCSEAVKYGDVTAPLTVSVKKILIIANPTSNQKSSMENLEEYCEPILHCAGLTVEIIKTDSEGHARRYVEGLQQLPDVLLVAGGDGTLSEAVTGLLRRSENQTCPIGVLPVGRTNTIGKKLFKIPNKRSLTRFEKAKSLADSAISVVRGTTEKLDVMKIEVLPNSGDTPGKPVYALGALQWGAFRDAYVMRDKYWYTASLRDYVVFVFKCLSDKLSWNCDAHVIYTPPCLGCSNCYRKPDKNMSQTIQNSRWWSKFIPKTKPNNLINQLNQIDYSNVSNEQCSEKIDLNLFSSELVVDTSVLQEKSNSKDDSTNKLEVKLNVNKNKGFSFIFDSWKRIYNNKLILDSEDKFSVRTIEILPNQLHSEENQIFFSIDNEAYEVKPIKISLIPKAVNMFKL